MTAVAQKGLAAVSKVLNAPLRNMTLDSCHLGLSVHMVVRHFVKRTYVFNVR